MSINIGDVGINFPPARLQKNARSRAARKPRKMGGGAVEGLGKFGRKIKAEKAVK